MIASHGRTWSCALITAVLLALTPGLSTADAQMNSLSSVESFPTIAVVTSDKVPVRTGSFRGFYHFGTLQAGDLVKVYSVRDGWAHIRTEGPAFKNFYGYIKYIVTETGRFRLSDDGRIGTTLGLCDVFAPNLQERDRIDESWKTILRLKTGTKVKVLSTASGKREIVHTVALPDGADGYISQAYLSQASSDQVAQWESLIAGETAQEQATKPEVLGREETRVTPVKAFDSQDAKSEPSKPESMTSEVASKKPAETAVDQSQEQSQRDLMSGEPSSTQDTPVRVPAVKMPETANSNESAMNVSDRVPASSDSHEEDMQGGEQSTAVDGQEPLGQHFDTLQLTLPENEAPDKSLTRLDQTFVKVRSESMEDAEFRMLQQLYQELADRATKKQLDMVARYASVRDEQIDVLLELQERTRRLVQLQRQAKSVSQQTDDTAKYLATVRDYVVVGRLMASTIYDGRRLPRLYRIQDPVQGHTLAYIQPGDHTQMITDRLGQIVGISGRKTYDGAMRINLVEPKEIDLLAPN